MVSIVICSFAGKEETLPKCIQSIKDQTHKPIDLNLMIGDALVVARQKGIEQSIGEYICFVDSDQVLSPTLIQDCVDACHSGFDGVTWFEQGINTNTFMEKVINYDKILFHSAHDDDPIKGSAIPRFFKKDFVDKIRWDKLPPITFEHTLLHKQIADMGAKIKFIDTKVYHHEPKTSKELFRKFFKYGYYYIPALRLDKKTILAHSKPRRVYFSLTALVEHPLLYLGLWYHYFIKGIACGLGILKYWRDYGFRE